MWHIDKYAQAGFLLSLDLHVSDYDHTTKREYGSKYLLYFSILFSTLK